MVVKARDEITLARVDDGSDGVAGADGQMLYATCETGSATVAKVAALASGKLTLKAGATVAVKFTYANNAASPTLNIGDTGAKAIYTQGVRYAYWAAGATVIFTYDGSNWRVASEPVYASTVTIGNPAVQNVYIDSDGVFVRIGEKTIAAFKQNEIDLGSWDDGTTAGDTASVNLFGGSGNIELEIGGTRDIMTVEAPELTLRAYDSQIILTNVADVNAQDLILHTTGNDISVVTLYERIADNDYTVVARPYNAHNADNLFTLNIRRNGGICVATIQWTGMVAEGTAELGEFEIPEKFRPLYDACAYAPAVVGNDMHGESGTRIRIKTNGKIRFSTNTQNFVERRVTMAYACAV